MLKCIVATLFLSVAYANVLPVKTVNICPSGALYWVARYETQNNIYDLIRKSVSGIDVNFNTPFCKKLGLASAKRDMHYILDDVQFVSCPQYAIVNAINEILHDSNLNTIVNPFTCNVVKPEVDTEGLDIRFTQESKDAFFTKYEKDLDIVVDDILLKTNPRSFSKNWGATINVEDWSNVNVTLFLYEAAKKHGKQKMFDDILNPVMPPVVDNPFPVDPLTTPPTTTKSRINYPMRPQTNPPSRINYPVRPQTNPPSRINYPRYPPVNTPEPVPTAEILQFNMEPEPTYGCYENCEFETDNYRMGQALSHGPRAAMSADQVAFAIHQDHYGNYYRRPMRYVGTTRIPSERIE